MRTVRSCVVLVVLMLSAQLGHATLFNTADQVYNSNMALGGNPAVRAMTKTSGVEMGMTLKTAFAQSKSLLEDEVMLGVAQDSVKGSDTDPMKQMTDLFIHYSRKMNTSGWLTVKYVQGTDIIRSYRVKEMDPPQTSGIEYYNDRTREIVAADYGMDIGGGKYVGIEVANNKYYERDYDKPNAALKALGGCRLQDVTAESLSYLSWTFGGIMELTNALKVSIAHKISNSRLMSKQGQSFFTNTKYNLQYTEELAPETSLGVVYQLDTKLSLGGSVQMVWDKNYTELGNRMSQVYSGPEVETEVHKVGYTKYAIASEYTWMNDLTTQAYYGWAINAEQVITDRDTGYVSPVDITDMGINVIKTFGEHTVIGGIARSGVFKKYDDDGDVRYTLDQTKLYLNYAFAF